MSMIEIDKHGDPVCANCGAMIDDYAEQHRQLAQAWAVFDELLQDHNKLFRYALGLKTAARAVVEDADSGKSDWDWPQVRLVRLDLIRAIEAALGKESAQAPE